jgi:hypothetical protein
MIIDKRIEMNLLQVIAALPDRSGSTRTEAAPLRVPSIARQRYLVAALCDGDHGDAVESLMRRELCASAISIEQIRMDRQPCRRFTRVVAVVTCTGHARAVLFRLVNGLGLDAAVRSIRWETMPSTHPFDAGYPLDAHAPPTQSATAFIPTGVVSANQ